MNPPLKIIMFASRVHYPFLTNSSVLARIDFSKRQQRNFYFQLIFKSCVKKTKFGFFKNVPSTGYKVNGGVAAEVNLGVITHTTFLLF